MKKLNKRRMSLMKLTDFSWIMCQRKENNLKNNLIVKEMMMIVKFSKIIMEIQILNKIKKFNSNNKNSKMNNW